MGEAEGAAETVGAAETDGALDIDGFDVGLKVG